MRSARRGQHVNGRREANTPPPPDLVHYRRAGLNSAPIEHVQNTLLQGGNNRLAVTTQRGRRVRCRASPKHRTAGAASSRGLGVLKVAAMILSIRLLDECRIYIA